MMNQFFGYCRVSACDQNEARQLIALEAFGITKEHIFIDKQSGRDFNRPAYQRLLKKLRPGDTMVIKSIDRLGRNYTEIQEQWRFITITKKVDINVLDMPLLNTEQHRDLTGTLIADIVLQLLSYVAQTEREQIKQRQAEGIAAAKARGARFGKPPLPIPADFEATYQLWCDGKLNSRDAAQKLSVSQNTFLKWAKCSQQEYLRE